MASEPPFDAILVLGVSRGGTTLISAALGSHPRIAMLDEVAGKAWTRITGGKIPGLKLCVPNQVDLGKKLDFWQRPLFWSGKMRKTMLANRIPKNTLPLEAYIHAFPRVQVVGILRDPDANIASILKRENRPLAVARFRWEQGMRTFDALHRRSDLSCLPQFVQFEKLVQTPQETLEKLCTAIGLDMHEDMLKAPENNSRYQSSGFDRSRANGHTVPNTGSKLCPESQRIYENLSCRAF